LAREELISVSQTTLLVAPFVRYVGENVIRSRRGYLAVVLAALVALQTSVALLGGRSASNGSGPVFLSGLLLITAPLCGSWLDEDVRLGFGAWWLQKPVSVLSFYLARLVAFLTWAVVASLAAASASALAELLTGQPLLNTLHRLIAFGWIPPLLVILAFLASGLGARNSALFAYGFLFAGFAMPGFADAVWLGAGYGLLKLVFPPVWAALDLSQAFASGDSRQALSDLVPLVGYSSACAALGLSLALRLPVQLARSD
jgi:hypothetical protein